MKNIVKILTILVIIAVFTLPASANADEYITEFESGLPDEYKGMVSDESVSDAIGPSALMGEILSVIEGRGGEVVSYFLLLMAGVALMSLCTHVGVISDSVMSGISVIISCVALTRCIPLFTEVCESITALSDVFAVFIPVASAISVSGGNVNAAAVGAVGMNVTLSTLTRLGTPFFLGLAVFGLAVGIVSSLGDESLAPLSSGVKKFFIWALGLVCALIMGLMSLQTFVAATRDSAAMRAAKYAATSMIPMVGSTVAGAMTTLATGLTYAKGIIGSAAVAIMMCIFISPMLMLLLYRTAVSLAASVASYLGIRRALAVYEALRHPFDLFIAVYSVAIILYIFEIALFLVTGVGVA